MLKPSDNPPLTWPEDVPICEFEGTWWVAHTKSRNEKALAQDLIARNVNYFLPMTWHLRVQRGRKLRVLLPLFSGYLFFCGGENDRLQALQTNRVAGIIEVTDQQRLVRQLGQIEQAILAGAPLEPHSHIKKGQKCRVKAGSLLGLQGIVVKTKNRARLVLQVDMLGQAASVEIDTDLLEVID